MHGVGQFNSWPRKLPKYRKKKLEIVAEGEKFDLFKANTEEENKFNAHKKRNKLIILIVGKTMVQMWMNTNI